MAGLVLISLLEFDAQQGLLPVAHAPSSECIEEYLKLSVPGLLPRRDGHNTPQTVQVGKRQAVSVSYSIEGPQYARNVYSFTVLMVLDPAASGRFSAGAYSRAASGLARRLAIAEEETALLSRREGDRRDRIAQCLAQVYQQLSETGQYELNGLVVNLRLEEALPVVPPHLTLDECVPHLVADLTDVWTMLAEDAAFSRLVPLIDGERSLQQISRMAHVDLEQARRAVADLM